MHTTSFFTTKKPGMTCHGCRKALAYNFEQIVHYGGDHYHLPCVLDLLPPSPLQFDLEP